MVKPARASKEPAVLELGLRLPVRRGHHAQGRRQGARRVTTRTGFRKTEFGNGVVKLNDRVLQMKGYAQRTSNEWPAVGMSVPAWLSDYSNGLALASNANLIRWMHIAPWKQDVESLDRIGLMQAMPAGDSEKDVDGRRWEQRIEAMRDAIVYNRNSPSILFYESGNKGVSASTCAR
jgi:beta-galactosidase